jgi:carbon-monoxide dehydrogenase large subunit
VVAERRQHALIGERGALCLDKAPEILGYGQARATQQQARAAGRHVGIGIGSYVEFCGFGDCTFLGFDRSAWEQSVVAVSRTDKISVQVGIVAVGQGHETTIAQEMGLPIDDIDVVQGDTDLVHYGTGTYNSRSISNAGSSSVMAAAKVMDKARRIAAHMLELALADLVYTEQAFSVAGDAWRDCYVAEVKSLTNANEEHQLRLGLGQVLRYQHALLSRFDL